MITDESIYPITSKITTTDSLLWWWLKTENSIANTAGYVLT